MDPFTRRHTKPRMVFKANDEPDTIEIKPTEIAPVRNNFAATGFLLYFPIVWDS